MNYFRAAAHFLSVGVWLWIAVSLVWLVLFLIGVPLCAWLSWRRQWIQQPSQRYPNKFKTIATWKAPRWVNYFWGNDEDGVTGDQRWWPSYCAAKASISKLGRLWDDVRFQAFMWSAIRNGVNGLRFTRLQNFDFDPRRLRYVGNSDDCSEDLKRYRRGEIKHRLFWFYAWHGVHPAFWAVWIKDGTRHYRVRLGSKITPEFRNGVPPGDYRAQSESFTPLQLSWPWSRAG